MNTGTVKFYNSQKGFGFIQPDNGQQDVFVHATALERSGISTLSDGQTVSFDTEVDSRSGKTAVNKLEPAWSALVAVQKKKTWSIDLRRRSYASPFFVCAVLMRSSSCVQSYQTGSLLPCLAQKCPSSDPPPEEVVIAFQKPNSTTVYRIIFISTFWFENIRIQQTGAQLNGKTNVKESRQIYLIEGRSRIG